MCHFNDVSVCKNDLNNLPHDFSTRVGNDISEYRTI